MNLQYDNELNERIYKRNIPGKNMKPNYDYRPTPTKYIDINKIKKEETNEEKLFTYKLEQKFNPGYRGEVKVLLHNHGTNPVKFKRGYYERCTRRNSKDNKRK